MHALAEAMINACHGRWAPAFADLMNPSLARSASLKLPDAPPKLSCKEVNTRGRYSGAFTPSDMLTNVMFG
jgi:hypothetical protein